MPAKKDGWGQWNGDLPEGPALDHLDELAKELGMTRAEANRVVLVAWSRSLRGIPLIPAMGGAFPLMATAGPGAMLSQQQISNQQDEDEQPISSMDEVRSRAAVTTSGLDLDDDD